MNRPVAAALILPDLRTGGAERVFLHLLRHLDRRRVAPSLLLGEAHGDWLDLVPDDVPVTVLGSARARGALVPLVGALRAQRPDVALATLGMTAALALARPALPASLAIINRLGNTISAERAAIAATAPVRARAYAALMRLIFASSDVVLTQCDAMSRDAMPWAWPWQGRLHRIYNPVDLDAIDALAREPAPALDPGTHAVIIGTLKPQKGVDIAIDALPSIRARLGDFVLHLAGDGPLRAELEQRAVDRGVREAVRFHGTMRNPFALARAAGLVISPSRFEGFSNAMLESAALGIVQVVTDCPGGNREIVTEGVNGLFASPEDPASLADAVVRAVRSRSALADEAHRERLRQRFALSAICDEYAALIEQIAASRAARAGRRVAFDHPPRL